MAGIGTGEGVDGGLVGVGDPDGGDSIGGEVAEGGTGTKDDWSVFRRRLIGLGALLSVWHVSVVFG